MKTAIAISGKSNSGKTVTINIIRKKLLSLNAIELKYFKKQVNSTDFISILKYKGKIIVLISAADFPDYMKGFFDLIDMDFEICVCATRSKGSTKEFIKNRFQNIIEIEKSRLEVNKSIIDTKDLTDIINNADADFVKKIIDKL